MSKVISFEPRVGKAKTGQTSGGFAAIKPKIINTHSNCHTTDSNQCIFFCLPSQYYMLTPSSSMKPKQRRSKSVSRSHSLTSAPLTTTNPPRPIAVLLAIHHHEPPSRWSPCSLLFLDYRLGLSFDLWWCEGLGCLMVQNMY